MKTLMRSLGKGLSAGEPLPDPYPAFKQAQIVFRRSSMQMIAGPPGSMKTMLTMNLVKQMGVPTIYHSSDSDDFTVATRALAMQTGMSMDEAELQIMTDPAVAQQALRSLNHIKWSFNPAPTLEHMSTEAEAFREVHGTYPHHTVIDIMMDVDFEGAGEQNYWGLMAELKVMAREQQTSLTVLHHTSESAKAGSPPPRSAIMGKANQLPATILTLWGDGERGRIDVATVKNRFGAQDPLGKKFFPLKVEPAICKVSDWDGGFEPPTEVGESEWDMD